MLLFHSPLDMSCLLSFVPLILITTIHIILKHLETLELPFALCSFDVLENEVMFLSQFIDYTCVFLG